MPSHTSTSAHPPRRPTYQGFPIHNWTPELNLSFEECKASLARATTLVHQDGTAPIALVTYASIMAMGAVLQRTKFSWQPLTSFSKKMSTVQQKYNVYDGTDGYLRGCKSLPTHVGGTTLCDVYRPQAIDLRLQPEV